MISLRSLALCSLVLTACPAAKPCDQSKVGNICTIGGAGTNGYSGDDGPAIDAELSLPQDTLTSSDGTTYVLDWNNHRIRKITTDGKMLAVAGRGELGGTLDDPANSDFNHPTGMAFDAQGNMLIAAWHNSKIRKIDLTTNAIVDTCGDGRRAYFGDNGPALTSVLDLPTSLAFAPSGDLIVMDQANMVLRRIDPSGNIHLYAGRCVIDAPMPAGPGACAMGVAPVACPMGSGKTTCGVPMEQCGKPCTPGYGGDEGPAADMRIAQPFGQSADPGGRIAFDAAGNLYFADTSNALIRKIDTQGVVHRFAGTAPVGGAAQRGFEGDEGPATSAKLNNPVDLAFGDDGTLYFTDTYNHCVRSIDAAGVIHTVVGTCGTSGTTGDDGPAKDALLKRPYGLEFVNGLLKISDTGNNRIRVVKLK
ncbi:MAG: hypothetical protein JNM17_31800 [Archangium sp.]|nr:hypothetical protein [Archangium sp.]